MGFEQTEEGLFGRGPPVPFILSFINTFIVASRWNLRSIPFPDGALCFQTISLNGDQRRCDTPMGLSTDLLLTTTKTYTK